MNIEKFWSKVNKTETCWNWTGATAKGFGAAFVLGEKIYAHRLSWMIYSNNSNMDRHTRVIQKCKNKLCVNPEHLYLLKGNGGLLNKILTNITVNSSGCWVWNLGTRIDGYVNITYQRKILYAHRASYELYNGPIPNDLHVLHTCDNRACLNPEHLFLGTNLDNMKDKVAKGRQAKDITHAMCKLTNEQVREIRLIYSTKQINQTELAKLFGVTSCRISRIVNMKERILA